MLNRQILGNDRVIEECLSNLVAEKEIRDIVRLLCDGLVTYRLYSFELENLIAHLVKIYPEHVLDRVFNDSEKSEHLIYLLFKETVNHGS
ncbi:hypothetical protein, partial [Vibrio anguillarum]